MENDPYYEKYLKYKAKYMALKEQQGGLLTFKNGVYAFFCPSSVANAICASIHGSAPSNAKVNEILEKAGVAYRGKKGDSELKIVKESSLKKTQAKAGVVVSAAASKAAAGISSGISSMKGKLSSPKNKVSLNSLTGGDGDETEKVVPLQPAPPKPAITDCP